MLFNSLEFILFLPIVVIGFYLLPKAFKNYWLLASSYFFYMSWKPAYATLILGSTIITYGCALLMHRYDRRKLLLLICLILNLSLLFFYKYSNFFLDISSSFWTTIYPDEERFSSLDIILPVGISFYVFQALGYVIDVYRGDIKPEKNFANYALFVSFFPQLVAGPIERSSRLLPQFKRHKTFNYDRVRSGFLLLLWGLFKKVVIADTIALYVNEVYNQPSEHYGLSIIIATILFSIQIYCDFSGYSDIAIGIARMMGYSLMKNFDNPYGAYSLTDFWRRWHISLSTWFRDYLYYPLGGNKKGTWRTSINLFIVFLVSGLWHGAAWNYLFWGAFHGLLMVLERHLSKPLKNALNFVPIKTIGPFLSKGYLLIAVGFSWLFFRANTLKQAKILLVNMTQLEHWKEALKQLDFHPFIILTIIMLFSVDFIGQKTSLLHKVLSSHLTIRWSTYTILLISILIYASHATEEANFIYFQF